MVLEEVGNVLYVGFFCSNGQIMLNKLLIVAGKGFLERVCNSGVEDEGEQLLFGDGS